jgi:hypothetical protein
MCSKIYRFSGLLALACILGVVFAFAFRPLAYAADTTVTAGGFIDLLGPYVTQGLGAVILGVFGWLAAALKAKWGIEIDAQMRAVLQQAAINGATKAFSQIEGTLGTKPIDVGSPLVAIAINYIQQAAPAAIAHFGLPPDYLASLVLAKLGALQAQMLTVAPAVAATAAPPVPAK